MQWVKSKPQKVVMENIWATHLLQLMYLDYLIIETTEGYAWPLPIS